MNLNLHDRFSVYSNCNLPSLEYTIVGISAYNLQSLIVQKYDSGKWLFCRPHESLIEVITMIYFPYQPKFQKIRWECQIYN